MDVGTILQIVNSAGVLGILVLIIFTGSKKAWVWGWMLDDVLKKEIDNLAKERDEWREIAKNTVSQTQQVAEKALTLADLANIVQIIKKD